VNRIERIADALDPGLSARLRGLKMRIRHDMDRRLIQAMTAPGDVCVDIGANRGAYTVLMSALVGRSGHVHAIEPFPGNRARLQTIARRRGNVTVHPVAVSDNSGTAVLSVPVHEGLQIDALASLEPRSEGAERCVVPVATLDDLLRDERRISFLKCDVEGHEQAAFRGAAEVIGTHQPVVLTEVEQRHRQDPMDGTFSFFAAAGYSGWFVTARGVRPLTEFDVARDQLDFLDGSFVPYRLPAGYVSDFLFCPPGAQPPRWALG
jgi:FkbM family methyltransferase